MKIPDLIMAAAALVMTGRSQVALTAPAERIVLRATALKTPAEEARVVGRSLHMEKCWGCHHETAAAFGPSWAWVAANRTELEVRAQIADPAAVAAATNRRTAMPKLDLTARQTDVIVDYIRFIGKQHEPTN